MKTQKAFSIVELLVATTILLILISIASSFIGNTKKNTRDSKRISDSLLLAKVLDTSAQSRGGVYASITGNKDCTKNISPTYLDLSSFSKNIIPSDPLSLDTPPSPCVDASDGYIYHRYASSGINYAITQKVFYSIEIGLEKTIDSGSKSMFKKPTEIPLSGITDGLPNNTNPTRYRYVLNGPYCGVDATSNRCY